MKAQDIEISIGLIKRNSSYICLKRNASPYKDSIEFPGGKKRSNETASLCLVRELKEELNISLEKFKYIGFIKHRYGDVLIKINIFKIFRYSGAILSNESRDIILYNNESAYKVLPTHKRILNTLYIPKLLKIIDINAFSNKKLDLSIYKYLRLRNITYDIYLETIKDRLKNANFIGKIIVDYPNAESWLDKFHGIHYSSNNIKHYNYKIQNSAYIHSASCHTEHDIDECNKRLFDFILLSPLLETHNTFPVLGWSKFSRLCLKSYSPTLALGGLSLNGRDYTNCINNNGFGLAGIRNV